MKLNEIQVGTLMAVSGLACASAGGLLSLQMGLTRIWPGMLVAFLLGMLQTYRAFR